MGLAATDQDDLEHLADLIRQNAPAIETLPLEPDGKYQLRRLTMATVHREVVEDLAAGFRALGAENFPFLFCGWGKARVGSTALNNLFGMAGLPSYYQPIKAMLRHRLSDSRPVPWCPAPASRHPLLFSKEVGGPYLLAECLYIPLQMLIEAGYPPNKLHLLLLDRQPVDCLTSWFTKWSDRVSQETLLRHHILATLNIIRVEDYARRQGVPVTHYVYEASKDAVVSARALFQRLGLAERFTESGVTDWEGLGDLDTDHAKVIYPDEPAAYVVPGLHGADTAYRFHDHGVPALSDATMDLLKRCGVFEIYRRSAQACIADLGLEPGAASKLFGLAE